MVPNSDGPSANQPNSGRKWPLLPSQTTQHSASALSEMTHTGQISRSFPTEVPHFIFLSLKSFSKVQVRVKESVSPSCVELPLGYFLIFPVLPNSENRENLISFLAKYPRNWASCPCCGSFVTFLSNSCHLQHQWPGPCSCLQKRDPSRRMSGFQKTAVPSRQIRAQSLHSPGI